MRRSVLTADLIVEGDVSSSGPVDVQGNVIGAVCAPVVAVSGSGRVEGAIRADDLTVLGVISGDIRRDRSGSRQVRWSMPMSPTTGWQSSPGQSWKAGSRTGVGLPYPVGSRPSTSGMARHSRAGSSDAVYGLRPTLPHCASRRSPCSYGRVSIRPRVRSTDTSPNRVGAISML